MDQELFPKRNPPDPTVTPQRRVLRPGFTPRLMEHWWARPLKPAGYLEPGTNAKH